MELLGSDSSGDDEEIAFKINENYAKNYEKWRKKEEKQKLIDRYGDAEDSSSSSSEEEEIRSTPQMDKDWLRAYAVVRFQQSRLYKEGEKFFHDEAKPVTKKKEKATTLKDHERKFILEKGGVESDEDTEPPKPQGKSYFEEQEEIKKSFKDAVADSDDEDSDEGNSGLLVKKHKTEEEKRKEENEYLEWLKGERDELEDEEAAAELAPLKAYWNDPSLSEKERTLRDYILNNGYMDQEDSDEDSDDDVDDNAAGLPNFETEEEFLEKAEEYEHKYNFRHEEPGGDEIKSYPRVIETSVRTKDTRRAEKRQRRMERKKSEREHRKEEIRLLQKLQREEKREKLEAVKKIADNPDLEYDLDSDFDPDQHNKIMQKYFNDDYYGDIEDTGKKPVFEYDAAVDDEPADWWQDRLKEDEQEQSDDSKNNDEIDDGDDNGQSEEDEPYEDDPNFIMDADYDPTRDYKAEKKRRKKYGKALAKKLPLFDPTTKTFDEYMEEYLEDKIDKLPFTYRDVVPIDFGLSTEEILTAQEKELNSWVSVKKMSQYRSRQEEVADKHKFEAQSRNVEKKLKVLPSLFCKPGDEDSQKKKKRRKKKKRKTDEDDGTQQASIETPATQEEEETDSTAEMDTSVSSNISKPTKRKMQLSEEVPVKRKKSKRSNSVSLSAEPTSATEVHSSETENTPKKKKKRKSSETGQQNENSLEASGEKSIMGVKLKRDKSSDRNCVKKAESLVNGDVKVPKQKKKKLKVTYNSSSDPSPVVKPGVDETGRMGSSSRETGTHTDVKVKKQKKKKKNIKPMGTGTSQAGPVKNGNIDRKLAKQKKKKLSISNFSSKAGPSVQSGRKISNKELERKLSKVMSAGRLSKYGIGPNAVKMSGKKKKKLKKKHQESFS